MIKIITDTSSDITPEQAKKMDVTLLTLPVTFEDTAYDQLNDKNFERFYTLLETSKALPVTSLSTPGEYLDIFNEAKRNGDSVVVIPISSNLSGSFQSACVAKEMADYDDIHIVDALQAIVGLRMLVEQAVKLRAEQKSADEIAAHVLEVSKRIRLYGAVDTMKYLIKGGRVPKTAGVVGTALNIKPIVFLQDGFVRPAGKARGRNGAFEAMFKHISEDMDFDPSFPFCFGYTKDREQMDSFSKLAIEKFNLKNTMEYPIGGVVGTHLGPNSIIAAWVVKSK